MSPEYLGKTNRFEDPHQIGNLTLYLAFGQDFLLSANGVRPLPRLSAPFIRMATSTESSML